MYVDFFFICKLWVLIMYMASPVVDLNLNITVLHKTKQLSCSDDIRNWLLWSCYGAVHFVKLVPRSSFRFEVLKEKISL